MDSKKVKTKEQVKELIQKIIQEALQKKEISIEELKKNLPKKLYYSQTFIKILDHLYKKGINVKPLYNKPVPSTPKKTLQSKKTPGKLKRNYDNIYMKEMTKHSLLTEEEEIELVELLESYETDLLKRIVKHPYFFRFFYFFFKSKHKKNFKAKLKAQNLTLQQYLKRKIKKALKKEQLLDFKKEFKIPRSDILRVAKEILDAEKVKPEVLQEIKNDIVKIEELQEKLINSNLRLVLSIAKKYARQKNNNLFDLIQEGNMGLIKAVEMFFYHQGVRFAAYAKWWIKQSIIRSLYETTHYMKIPLHFIESIRKLEDFMYQYLQEKKENPSFEQIVEGTGFSKKKVIRILQIINKPLSLDTPVFYKDNFIELKDLIKDNNYLGPHIHIFNNMVLQNVKNLLLGLSERERSILVKRYGLEDGIQRTLDEVGYYFNLTRERIRQIERKALEKLKVPSKMVFCKKLLEGEGH